MRPIDAAVAGTDSLVILDEAHLAPHLRALLPALAACTPGAQAMLGEARSRPSVVALTATGDAGGASRFDLDADDEAHEVVRQRLDAVKPTQVRILDTGDVGQRLAEAALHLIREAPAPAACVVFANTPKSAREAFGRLRKLATDGSAEVLLLTGRAREREAERTRARILDPVHGMASTREAATSRHRHLIVVATQTLEVGADIDAEVPRHGGVRRAGAHAATRQAEPAGASCACPCDLCPSAAGRAAEETQAARRELQRVAGLRRGTRECAAAAGGCPASHRHGRGEPVAPPGRRDFGRARRRSWPGAAGLAGAPVGMDEDDDSPGRRSARRTVLLRYRRTGIFGVADLARPCPEDGELLWPRARDREAVEIPIHEARAALGGDDDLRRLGSDGVTIEKVSSDDLRPGDSVVLPSDRGLLDEFGWNPSSTSPVVDMSVAEHGVPLNTAALRRLGVVSIGDLIDRALGTTADEEDIDEAERAEAVEQILTVVAAATPPGWDQAEWNGLVASLTRQIVTARDEVPRFPRRAAGSGPRSDELDEMSLAETAVRLDLHGTAVAVRARSIAERLGIPADLAEVVERAGRLHDIGKADRRFQRWLDPDEKYGGVRVAKSNMPRNLWDTARAAAGWPRGGRHEELSARLVRQWLERHPAWCDPSPPDLLLHLIISHHGGGRPLLPPVTDDTTDMVSGIVEDTSVEVPANLSIVDWEQPARFRHLSERLGPWGLALLEAIVRQADHAVSAGTAVGHLEVR